MPTTLHTLLAAFDTWAPTHSQNENGWETSFPRYPELIAAALESMKLADPADTNQLKLIARVWSLSEETEDLSEAVKADPAPYARILPALIPHADWRARFQIYALAPHTPALGAPFLLRGLSDPDPYVLRRILLALHEIDPEAASRTAPRFTTSTDVHLRTLALRLASQQAP